ncbi:MAG: MMPL family transporter, partial [Bacteroidota bacterium]
VLASLGAALTLPGMAGIILTVGMAVDANVLIFERIREELSGGKSMRMAVADGFKNAYSSIIDANVTPF